MKNTKKLLIALVIVLFAGVIVPNIVPALNSTISVEASSVRLNVTKKTLYVKNTYTLKVTGTKKKVAWYSSNKKVATVSSKGKVTAKKKGTTTITAKVGSKKYTCKITVKNPYMNKTKLNLYPYEQYSLCVNGRKNVKWTSSNKKVAIVTSKGRVKAVKKGTVKITAKYGKEKYTCSVKVNPYIENKNNAKTGKNLLNYTIDILSNAKLKDIDDDKDKVKGMSDKYYYRQILDYKNDFEGKYTKNCLNKSWKNKNYVFHIEEINGKKYLATEASCGDESYIRTDLYIKKSTYTTVVFNAVSHFTKNSPYRTKIGEFVIKKENGKWKVDKFPVVWF